MLCIDEFVWKFSSLLIMKFINENIELHGTGRIYSCLIRLLHEALGCASVIILQIFFCKVKIFPVFEELPPKNYSILYSRMKVCIVNWFAYVNVTDMDHRPNGVTCCMWLRNHLFSTVTFLLCALYFVWISITLTHKLLQNKFKKSICDLNRCVVLCVLFLEWLGLKHNVCGSSSHNCEQQSTSNRTVVDTSSNVKRLLCNWIVQLPSNLNRKRLLNVQYVVLIVLCNRQQ
jgi:hypothetical protein